MGRLDARTDWRVKLGGDWPGDMTLSTTMVECGDGEQRRAQLDSVKMISGQSMEYLNRSILLRSGRGRLRVGMLHSGCGCLGQDRVGSWLRELRVGLDGI